MREPVWTYHNKWSWGSDSYQPVLNNKRDRHGWKTYLGELRKDQELWEKDQEFLGFWSEPGFQKEEDEADMDLACGNYQWITTIDELDKMFNTEDGDVNEDYDEEG